MAEESAPVENLDDNENICGLAVHPICELKFDDKRSFTDSLRLNKTSRVWAFKYAKEVNKKTAKIVRAYRQKFIERHGILTDGRPSSDTPSCSVTADNEQGPHPKKRARYSETGDALTPERPRATPLPAFTWANSNDVWKTMVKKEEAESSRRSSRLFENPPSCLPRRRAVLVDWIMEVCDSYRLRRVTYYLAIDYIDRYLTIQTTFAKHQLQLVGISALFIAVKFEERGTFNARPTLTDLSYMCDGVCSNEQILECEGLLLNTLGWELNPLTPTGWLNLYMQVLSDFMNNTTTAQDKSKNFLYPQYSQYDFVRASHFMDLFSMDPGFILFSYSVIAACAMYFMYGREAAIRVSGLAWNDIEDCAKYMKVYCKVIGDAGCVYTTVSHTYNKREIASYSLLKKSIPGIHLNDEHSIQRYFTKYRHFEKAVVMKIEQMGFHVLKIYVRTKKLYDTSGRASLKIINESEYIEADDNLIKGPNIVMYKIKRMSASEREMLTGDAVITVSETDTSCFDGKLIYTIDEMLIAINNCISKVLITRRMGKDIKN